MPWVFLSLPANFIFAALITQYFDLSPVLFGYMASLPAFCNAAQVFLIPFIAKYLNGRDLTLGMAWFNLGLWGMFTVMIGFVDPANTAGITGILFLFFIAISLSGSFIGVGWTSWVQEWVPGRVRGTYFGKRNRFIHFTTISFLLISMIVLMGRKDVLWAYQVVILAAVAMRFFSLLWQHTIKAKGEGGSLVHSKWFKELGKARRDPLLGRYIMFAAWTAFWLNFVGPFGAVYMYEELAIKPYQVSLLAILSTSMAALTVLIWGKLTDLHGGRNCIILSLILWQASGYLWVILTPETSFILYGIWLWGGVASGGYLLGSFLLLLKVLPKECKAAGISLHLAITSLFGGIAPVIAGTLLDYFTSQGIEAGFLYRIGFFLSPTFVILGLLLVRRLPEPGVAGDASAFGAMRTIRQTMIFGGLLSAVNSTFIRRTPKADGQQAKQ